MISVGAARQAQESYVTEAARKPRVRGMTESQVDAARQRAVDKAVASAIEQVLYPELGVFTVGFATDMVAKPILDRLPFYGLLINEALELWKNSVAADRIKNQINRSRMAGAAFARSRWGYWTATLSAYANLLPADCRREPDVCREQQFADGRHDTAACARSQPERHARHAVPFVAPFRSKLHRRHRNFAATP